MKRLFILGLGVALLAGCGVKPSAPDAPNPDSGFPHTYPNPATDPAAKIIK